MSNADHLDAAATTRKYRLHVRRVIQEGKNVPCADCGVQYPYYVMDYDHRDGEVKSYNLNRMPGRHGLARVRKEMAKCDVVCSNCHRERTNKRIMFS